MKNAFAEAAKKQTKKKSKSTAHCVNIDGIDEAIEKWQANSMAKKNAEAIMKICEKQLIPIAESERLKESQSIGECVTTVRLNGKINVTAKNQYSEIADDDVEQLSKIFGKDFKRFFAEKLEISLTPKAIEDEEIVAKLVAAVGEENLTEYFEIKQKLVPTTAFHNERSTNQKIGEKAAKAINDGLVKPYKSTFKSVG